MSEVKEERRAVFIFSAFIVALVSALLAIMLCGGCCDPGVEPGWPHGKPDNVSRIDERNGAIELIYTYRCLQGEHVRITYFRPDRCSNFERIGEDRSDGICD